MMQWVPLPLIQPMEYCKIMDHTQALSFIHAHSEIQKLQHSHKCNKRGKGHQAYRLLHCINQLVDRFIMVQTPCGSHEIIRFKLKVANCNGMLMDKNDQSCDHLNLVYGTFCWHLAPILKIQYFPCLKNLKLPSLDLAHIGLSNNTKSALKFPNNF